MYLPWKKPAPKFPPAKVIAEIGCNHMGEMEIAKELIKKAHECGAYCAKFQKRCVRALLSEEEFDAPHPNPVNSFGESYGRHREYLELTVEQHAELKAYCDELGIVYSTSVWDVPSAKEIVTLKPELIKVPSAINTNQAMLEVLADEYEGEVHVSFGMSYQEEMDACIEFFEQRGQAKDRLVIYSCTSGYPVPHHEVNLLDLRAYREKYGDRVKAIGFSGHHLGIALDIAAYALGAEWIERHFTLDRTWKGTDHAASLETQGLLHLVRDLEAVALAWQEKSPEMAEIEMVQRNKLKFKS